MLLKKVFKCDGEGCNKTIELEKGENYQTKGGWWLVPSSQSNTKLAQDLCPVCRKKKGYYFIGEKK